MHISLRFIVISTVLGLMIGVIFAAARSNERVSPVPKCNKDATVWRGLTMPKGAKSGDIWINPVDGAEMVYIKEGSFKMGNNDIQDERPVRKVALDAYWVSRYEVTVGQYQKFCEITGRKMPEAPPEGWLALTPMVNVDWNDAAAYAKWANGQLPSEAQWEKAARGVKDYAYPWGSGWDPTLCNNGLEGKNAPMKVGSFPNGASRYGVMDLAGNVAEWCDTPYQKKGDVSDYRVIRGGSCYDNNPNSFRTSHRDYLVPSARANVIGFRYVLKAD